MTLALRCTLRAGVFSGEKVYRLTLADGTVWESLAPRPHCWHPDWRPIADHEPTEEIDALVECRCWNMDPVSGGIYVDVPDHMETARVCVKPDAIVQRPQETVDEMLARMAGAK